MPIISGHNIPYTPAQFDALLDKINNLADATASVSGLMSAADKASFDNINLMFPLKADTMMMESVTQSSYLITSPNKYSLIMNPVGNLIIKLPNLTSLLYVQETIIGFTTGATPNVSFQAQKTIYYQDGLTFDANTRYEVHALFNGIYWTITAFKFA